MRSSSYRNNGFDGSSVGNVEERNDESISLGGLLCVVGGDNDDDDEGHTWRSVSSCVSVAAGIVLLFLLVIINFVGLDIDGVHVFIT